MLLGVTACLTPASVECADGLVCAGEKVCAPLGGGCVDPAAVAACEPAAPELSTCAFGAVTDGICARQVCVASGCGNGVTEVDEACDDGNQLNGDGCSRGCDSLEACGNSVTDGGEQCDDGNLDDLDGCRHDCTLVRCGDGVVDDLRGEACDLGDGNSNAANASCRLTCDLPGCGDGATDSVLGEVCDDGNRTSGDGCRSDCNSTGACGNGSLDGNEQCDDQNLRNRDGCSSACTAEAMTWPQVRLGPPSVRQGAGMAYDAARQRIVLFGGRDIDGNGGNIVDSAETWEFDGAAWILMAPATSSPPRYASGMAYDAVHGRTILFGDQSDQNSQWDDTWAWNGINWQRVESALSPQGRLGGKLSYDAGRQRLVLFGG